MRLNFFNFLFDKLERQLAELGKDNILKEIFGGTVIHQIIGKDSCTHKKERSEPFYSISVEIKDKSSLEESLELFTDGELLSGDNKYNCEDCEQQVEALLRIVIGDLPPMLFIHLKRFQYNYENDTREKLNSTCSFPMELDIFNYTKEGLAKKESERDDTVGFDESMVRPHDYYLYELVGIVVHAGNIDSGHYTSYIKEYNSQNPRWLHFDDTNVTEFNPDDIQYACFGGYDDIEMRSVDDPSIIKTTKKARLNNAYLLLYKRKGESKLQINMQKQQVSKSEESLIDIKRRELFFGRDNQNLENKDELSLDIKSKEESDKKSLEEFEKKEDSDKDSIKKSKGDSSDNEIRKSKKNSKDNSKEETENKNPEVNKINEGEKNTEEKDGDNKNNENKKEVETEKNNKKKSGRKHHDKHETDKENNNEKLENDNKDENKDKDKENDKEKDKSSDKDKDDKKDKKKNKGKKKNSGKDKNDNDKDNNKIEKDKENEDKDKENDKDDNIKDNDKDKDKENNKDKDDNLKENNNKDKDDNLKDNDKDKDKENNKDKENEKDKNGDKDKDKEKNIKKKKQETVLQFLW